MGVHQAKIKRALPWVFVAAMVTALLRGGDGQAAKRMWSAEELRRKGKKFKGINAPKDALTGEILPPYQSKKGGKPRSFNSDETKRVKSLKSSLENAYGKVHDTGHIWNPEQLRYEVADYGQWQSNLKAYTVCDGDIVFRNTPGMFSRRRYTCVPAAEPKRTWVGSAKKGTRREVEWGTTGETMTYNRHPLAGARRGGKKTQEQRRKKKLESA